MSETIENTARGRAVFEAYSLGDKAPIVESATVKAGELWELFDSFPFTAEMSETGRLIALAKTNLEQSLMWFTKAVSRAR